MRRGAHPCLLMVAATHWLPKVSDANTRRQKVDDGRRGRTAKSNSVLMLRGKSGTGKTAVWHVVRGTSGRVNLHRCGTWGAGQARAAYSKIKNMCFSLTEGLMAQFPFTLQGELIWPVMESAHYFSTSPAGPFTRKPLNVELLGQQRALHTSAGIFSPDGIDKGTAVLLADVPAPAPQGNLLDIGCGWGPIALTMALRAPHARVYAVDVNERCIALTNENAATLGLANVSASTPEAVDPELRFDTIWSNPPIRVGKDELHSLLLLWLPRLAPGGTAWLVVQKNLGSDSLQRWLATELDATFTVSRESTAKSFRILKVRKASQSPQ